jgi:hypothetical protein
LAEDLAGLAAEAGQRFKVFDGQERLDFRRHGKPPFASLLPEH